MNEYINIKNLGTQQLDILQVKLLHKEDRMMRTSDIERGKVRFKN
jgi:hypothetical protein